MDMLSFDDWVRSAAGDGAAVSPANHAPPTEFDEIYRAWSIERGLSIESEFLLNLSRAAIAQLLANDAVAAQGERIDTRSLIEQIESHLKRRSSRRP